MGHAIVDYMEEGLSMVTTDTAAFIIVGRTVLISIKRDHTKSSSINETPFFKGGKTTVIHEMRARLGGANVLKSLTLTGLGWLNDFFLMAQGPGKDVLRQTG